jgi:hypothetical protein
MRHFLVIQRYNTVNEVYNEVASSVLTENDVIYPDLNGATAKLLMSIPSIPYVTTDGVGPMGDGWSYYNSAAKPAPSVPVVTLPTNDEALPPVDSIPGSYELRCKVFTQV